MKDMIHSSRMHCINCSFKTITLQRSHFFIQDEVYKACKIYFPLKFKCICNTQYDMF